MEVVLRPYDIRFAMPYWDPPMDNGFPKREDSILWTSDFFEKGNGKVVTGPSKNWRLFNGDCCLERDLGKDTKGFTYAVDMTT